MPIIVNQISSPLNATEQEVISTALKKLGSASKHAIDCEIHKSSLDARKRNDIHFVHSVFVTLDSADLEKKLCEKNTSLTYVERSVYKLSLIHISKLLRQSFHHLYRVIS